MERALQSPIFLCTLLVFAGGLGAVSRHWLSGVLQSSVSSEFPWGIVCVNLLGCFLFGFSYVMLKEHGQNPFWSLLVMTGFLGAFTTFSTFIFDILHLLEQSKYWLAIANFSLQNVLGLFVAWLGLWFGRWWAA